MQSPLVTNPNFKVSEISVALPRPKNFELFHGNSRVEQHTDGPRDSSNKHSAGLLSSWKEISVYLSRGVRTVQRWEQTMGLPVHRIGVGNRAPVFAFEHEIDRWLGEKAGTLPVHSATAMRVHREHLNPQQQRLIYLIEEFRQSALKLEQAVATDGFEPNVYVADALLTIQKLMNAALNRNPVTRIELKSVVSRAHRQTPRQ